MRCLLSLLLIASCASGQTDYKSNAEAAFDVLQQYYNTTSGIWDTCGWWNGANCMTAIADLAAADSSVLSTATSVFAHTYTQAPQSNPQLQVTKVATRENIFTYYGSPPGNRSSFDHFGTRDSNSGNPTGFIDSCYDDNGWWALAWVKAYDLTQESSYLDTASGILANMTGAGPTNCSNGGIYWCSDSTYVNAIANELFLSVAAHLANRVSGTDQSQYIALAQKQWSWFQNSGLINSQGTINDGLSADCSNNGETVWSYNQGVILGALVELSKADSASSSSYLDAANSIAKAAIANLTDSNMVVRETCEPDCAPDGTQFKGVFMRNLMALQQASPDDLYQNVIVANANSIWANDNQNGNLSVSWAGPFVQPGNASTQSSALDALVAAVVVG